MLRVRLLILSLLLIWLPTTASAGELRTFDSRRYRIHTDLETAFADDLAKRMDAMYDEYARRLAVFNPPADAPRLEVYLFTRQRDYLTFTHQRLRNTGGVYMPKQNRLAAFLEGQGRDGLRRTLQHEAFHQFAYTVISRELPVWLNEGMAQVFEEAIWTGEGFWIGHVPPRRIRQIQADLKANRLIDFERMLALSPEDWATNLTGDRDLGATQYNQAWAMVHFLSFAPDEHGKPLHRHRLIDLLKRLNQGEAPDVAFRSAFSANVRGFQDRFLEYARDLTSTPTATLIERQAVLGDLLSELSRRGDAFANLGQFKKAAIAGGYRMQYTKGELTWETDADLGVYFSDIAGRTLRPDELYFAPRAGALLPDIVCRPADSFQLRTRFHRAGERVECEVVLERLPTSAANASRASRR
jgi:hypothetical protein